jgi:hydroxymethylpyrimidine pyrophosphatase-like HAD family hydrolase
MNKVKKYSAVFFDWDGTAVLSRKAPVDNIIDVMAKLLGKIPLVIISGTTYENIAGGELHHYFDNDILDNLYLGLGRGALNYGFKHGEPIILQSNIPDKAGLVKIHEICFAIHAYLMERYTLMTDIVFSRPNYCKIDLMTDHDRGSALFLQKDEIDRINALLTDAGISGGLRQLINECTDLSKRMGMELKITSDAKYLEAGLSTKSDNTNYFLEKLSAEKRIKPEECCFFGDEFCFLDDGVSGSDALMITELSRPADFFDVSPEKGRLPENVAWLGGGVATFKNMLTELYQLSS